MATWRRGDASFGISTCGNALPTTSIKLYILYIYYNIYIIYIIFICLLYSPAQHSFSLMPRRRGDASPRRRVSASLCSRFVDRRGSVAARHLPSWFFGVLGRRRRGAATMATKRYFIDDEIPPRCGCKYTYYFMYSSSVIISL